jgi:hypothetical protein
MGLKQTSLILLCLAATVWSDSVHLKEGDFYRLSERTTSSAVIVVSYSSSICDLIFRLGN